MKSTFWNIIGIIAVVIAILFAYQTSKGKKMSAGIKTENMDTTVKAGDDFYRYANGGWCDANPIPDDYTRFGAFEVLRTKLLWTQKNAMPMV